MTKKPIYLTPYFAISHTGGCCGIRQTTDLEAFDKVFLQKYLRTNKKPIPSERSLVGIIHSPESKSLFEKTVEQLLLIDYPFVLFKDEIHLVAFPLKMHGDRHKNRADLDMTTVNRKRGHVTVFSGFPGTANYQITPAIKNLIHKSKSAEVTLTQNQLYDKTLKDLEEAEMEFIYAFENPNSGNTVHVFRKKGELLLNNLEMSNADV
jgi:hypothetical protein